MQQCILEVRFTFWILREKKEKAQSIFLCVLQQCYSSAAAACPKGNFLCSSNSCARTTVQKFAFGNRGASKQAELRTEQGKAI